MDDVLNFFAHRQAVLVTMHGKESVIGPVLAQQLGLHVTPLTHIDTDQFGTFTGDITRRDSQHQTAIAKAMAGITATSGDLALASEGSFGPHPDVPWLTVNRELVVLVDRQHDWVLEGWATSVETSAARCDVTTVAEAQAFCQRVGFPEQGVIVRAGEQLFKECMTAEVIDALVASLLRQHPVIQLETDLRAHRNPKRRAVIRLATEQLVANMRRLCRECGAPGMRIVETLYGLPCEWCGTPTHQRKADVFGCVRCTHREEQLCGDGVASAEYCTMCNP